MAALMEDGEEKKMEVECEKMNNMVKKIGTL